jgi:hypothetical protein
MGKWSLPRSGPWVKEALVNKSGVRIAKSKQDVVPQRLSMYIGKLASFDIQIRRASIVASKRRPEILDLPRLTHKGECALKLPTATKLYPR